MLAALETVGEIKLNSKVVLKVSTADINGKVSPSISL